MLNQLTKPKPLSPVEEVLGTQRQIDYPPRPIVTERPNYEPACPQEEFIVPLLRQRIEATLARYAVPSGNGQRALDVGCGRQPFRKELEIAGYSYASMDAQQNVEGAVDFISAIDEQLPMALTKSGPFQFVLCTEVLEHVAKWDAAFKNFAALLENGGKLLITCPHFYQLHEEPYDFWRPTLHALRFFAADAGLRVLHEDAAGDGWDVLGTLVANCRPSVRSDGLIGRAASRLLVLTQKVIFTLLRYRWPQRLIELQGPLYLSNVVVFEKP